MQFTVPLLGIRFKRPDLHQGYYGRRRRLGIISLLIKHGSSTCRPKYEVAEIDPHHINSYFVRAGLLNNP